MKKIKKILPYKLIIALCLIVIIGSVGYTVKASSISENILDRVAEKIANIIMGEFESEGMLGDKVQFDNQIFTQDVSISGATTLSGTLAAGATTITGQLSASTKIGVATTTPANQLEVHAATGTSTASFIAETAGSGGRIILEDSDGAGCSEIYILNGTITSATVACPAN